MTLGLVPEILDSVDMIPLIGKEFRVVDAKVVKLVNIKSIVGLEMIRIDDAIGSYLVPDNGHERFRFCVGDDGLLNFATPLK